MSYRAENNHKIAGHESVFELEGSPCIRRICWLTTAVHWDSGMLTAQAGIAEGGKVKPDMAALTWSQSTDSSVD